jgi:hypothetical protein
MSGDRADYIRGLRNLADVLEQNDDLPLPHQGSVASMTFYYLSSPDPVSRMIAAMQAIPCGFTSEIVTSEDNSRAYLHLDGELHGVMIKLTAFLKDTCAQDEDGTWRITDAITSRAPEAEASA